MLNTNYEQWLWGSCCCESHTTPIGDCGDKEQCSCENILLEISNLHTTDNVLSGEVDEKQDKLIAGDNITISGNVISAVGGEGISSGDVQTMIENNLNGYATEQWVDNKGYLTEHQHLKTINGQVISGDGNIEIATSGGSVTVDDHIDSASTNPVENKAIYGALNGKLDATAYTPTDLSNYYNKQEVNNLIPTVPSNISAFINDAHYITSGDSVFNNYATTANTYTKTEVNNLVNNKFWCGTQQEYNALVNKENGVLYLIHN